MFLTWALVVFCLFLLLIIACDGDVHSNLTLVTAGVGGFASVFTLIEAQANEHGPWTFLFRGALLLLFGGVLLTYAELDKIAHVVILIGLIMMVIVLSRAAWWCAVTTKHKVKRDQEQGQF